MSAARAVVQLRRRMPRAFSLAAPFAVLALAVAGFTMTPLFIERRASALHGPAAIELTSSVRTLDSLIDMRAQQHLAVVLAGPLAGMPQAHDARDRLAADLRAYIASRGESPALAAALRAFVAAAERPDADRRLLHQRSERLNLVLMDELATEQRRASAAAATVEAVRARSIVLSNGLNLAWAIAALIGGTVAALLVFRHHRLSGELRRLERERAHELEEFATRVAHDVVSPLGSVSAGVHVLARKLHGDAQGHAVARSLRVSLTRVSAIVDELLRFARAGGRPAADERADLRRVAESVRDELAPVARDKGVALSVAIPERLEVACAEAAMFIVLQNLLRNAIKYIGDGPRRLVRAWADVTGARVRLVVEDTGPGIPPGMERAVFQPYVRGPRAREPGFGLGLATVKRLVESREGKVGVSSAPQRGARFWVELPLAPEIRAG